MEELVLHSFTLMPKDAPPPPSKWRQFVRMAVAVVTGGVSEFVRAKLSKITQEARLVEKDADLKQLEVMERAFDLFEKMEQRPKQSSTPSAQSTGDGTQAAPEAAEASAAQRLAYLKDQLRLLYGGEIEIEGDTGEDGGG